MPVRVLLVSLLLAFDAAGAVAAGSLGVEPSPPGATTDTVPDTVPDSTFNEFIPEQNNLSDCISAAPKPGCGSENRSDWHVWAVFLALVGGLVVIGWRIVAGARKPAVDAASQPANEPSNEIEHSKPV